MLFVISSRIVTVGRFITTMIVPKVVTNVANNAKVAKNASRLVCM